MALKSSDELIERWIRGDRAAAREIYDRYYRRAWKFGMRITKREIDADDLAQEAIANGLEVVRDPSRRPAKFTGWLLGVVKHIAWRRNSRKQGPLPKEDLFVDTRHGRPSGPMIEGEMSALMERALASLTPEERAVVEDRVMERMPRAEIARRVGCSLDTVDRRLRSAIARLREQLSGHFTTMVLSGPPPTMERVMALRPSFRAAFLARHVEGLGMEETARKLGIPLATLKERLAYAYQKLSCGEGTDFSALRAPV